MWVIKDEFYCANEYNAIAEYTHFPAETYAFTKEVTGSGKEYADTGAEVTTLQRRKNKKTLRTNGENNVLNKLMSSVKGVAVTSTVAAAAVLGAAVIAPPPKVNLLELSVGGTYVEYQLSIEELQDDLEYFIIVSTSNEDERSFAVDESGIYQNKIDGLKPTWEYTLSFVSYDEYWGKTTYFEETFQTTGDVLPDYDVGISTIEVSSLNEIRVHFWHTGLDDAYSLELLLDCGDSEELDLVPITTRDLQRGYVTVPVAETATSISVTPAVKYGKNQRMEFVSYKHSFDRALNADVKVDSYNSNLVFYLKGITRGATTINVVNTQTQATVMQEALYSNYVTIPYTSDETSVFAYTIFLTDSDGQRTTDNFTTEIDTTIQNMPSYTFDYKNPGDVGVTYNDDGTINVYIQTDFACEDERLYYQVTLGDTRYQTREPIFVAEGLDNQSHPLIYEICYDNNGIQYVISNTSVSGTVNEFDFKSSLSPTVSEQWITLTGSYLLEAVDLNSIRLVSSTGEEIQVTENDFVYYEDGNVYICTKDFENAFEYVTIYATCSPFADNMAGIDTYVGSLSTQFQTTIYN